jgi:N-acetylmuramoyl-L-alanine amidase
VETYYFGPNSDRKVAELAAKENADSQYMYAEFKEMVEKIGNTMKFQESRGLADSVQEALYPQIRKVNKKARNHGIKPGPFVVLLGIDAPSILTEVTSLSNKQEEERLKSPAYRDKIAAFLEKGIVNYLNKTTNSPGGEPNGNGEEKENLAQAKNNKYR